MSVSTRGGEPLGWMSRAEYHQWAEGRPGRYERLDGHVIAMAPERVGHTRIKGEAFVALRAAVAAASLPCEVLIDGPTIEVGESDYEPDVIVRCGADAPAATERAVPDPIILVEVLSPTTRRIDVSRKLADYFHVPSVQHYLILFSDRIQAVHHRRVGEQIETRVLAAGEIVFDPPGIRVPLVGLYPRSSSAAGEG